MTTNQNNIPEPTSPTAVAAAAAKRTELEERA